MHRSPGICLTAEENHRKTSARRSSDEGAMRRVIASNVVPFLQMRLEGSHNTSRREKEGKKERMGLRLRFTSVALVLENTGLITPGR